jgi:hypothetical protein
MKPRTLALLALLAADREALHVESIRRAQAALRQSATHRGLLAEYRDRLGASWQSGAVVSAGQARRAGQFVQASFGAEAQVEAAQRQAGQQLATAQDGLAQVQARRRALREAIEAQRNAAERDAEQAAERALAWRGRRGAR